MHFKPEVRDTELPEILRRFINIADRKRWEKRLAWLDREARRDVGMRHFWQERCALELAFSHTRRQYRNTGRIWVDPSDTETLRFLAFAAMTVSCHDRLTPEGRSRLEGMLRGATTRDFGLGPLGYEMKVASHLMSRGYDVTFHDLEGGRGYDFLAAKAGVSVEVECKHMSGDAGRKIHRKELYRFGDRAAVWMRDHLASLTTGLFVRLTIPGRLESGDQYQKALCKFVGQALLSGEPDAERDGNRIQVQEFDVEQVAGPWPPAGKFDRTEMEARLTHHFGLAHKNALLYLRPHQSVVALLIQSEQKDDVLNGMHTELRKSSKDQFTGELPAILCCHLADLTQEQMLTLGRGGHGRALDSLATDLMRRRPHLYSVTFTAAGSVSADSVREKGPAYTIFNRDHPSAADERLSIFRDGWT